MATTTNNKSANNTPAVNAQLAAEVNKKMKTRSLLVKAYQQEEQVQVQGSPFYRPYFGNNMPLIINGIAVYVPLDGRPYKIPKTFADLFNKRLGRIDSLIQKQGQLSAIAEESFAGEVDLLGTVE